MKTFEEKFTAWIDGRLTGNELAGFEADLAQIKDADAEKEAALKLGALLRDHIKAPELNNAEFFNHQLLQQIELEKRREAAPVKRAPSFWTLTRLVWAGSFCMAAAAALFFIAVPRGVVENPSGNEYVAQITNARTDDPAITATTIHSKDNKLTVLWLDGLEYLPAKDGR